MPNISPKTYSIPLSLALEYKRLLNTPEIGSQTARARKVGVSPARVSQLLRLFKLPADVQQSVIQMGDPLTSRKVTERKLRVMLVAPLPG